LKEAKVADFN